MYSVEARWTLRSLLCCRFHCIDKGKVAENFAEESVVFYFNSVYSSLWRTVVTFLYVQSVESMTWLQGAPRESAC